jgi:hypothetical protein
MASVVRALCLELANSNGLIASFAQLPAMSEVDAMHCRPMAANSTDSNIGAALTAPGVAWT